MPTDGIESPKLAPEPDLHAWYFDSLLMGTVDGFLYVLPSVFILGVNRHRQSLP